MGATNAILSPADKPAAPELLHDDSVALPSKTRLDRHYLFYCITCGQNAGSEGANNVAAADEMVGGLPAPYSWTIWRPRIWPSLPPGLSGLRLKLKFLFRWAVHRLHLFAGSGCGALLVYDRERLVHYSGYTPGYWRFPFIVGDDFQIGDTWTDPAHRRRGLAIFALRTVVTKLARPGRRLWYVVEAINAPSIRVAEKAQFKLTAEGEWVTPWGFKLAGAYVIHKNCSA
ncbi:MAG TPA: GNAT family protein [Candidatus Binataceae bacterium]|nr:GNAT family protein [Candidatus Binataceae bacterium]